jgi:hypothetical protein
MNNLGIANIYTRLMGIAISHQEGISNSSATETRGSTSERKQQQQYSQSIKSNGESPSHHQTPVVNFELDDEDEDDDGVRRAEHSGSDCSNDQKYFGKNHGGGGKGKRNSPERIAKRGASGGKKNGDEIEPFEQIESKNDCILPPLSPPPSLSHLHRVLRDHRPGE